MALAQSESNSASEWSSGVFTRQATGLVRGVSARGAVAMNIAYLGPPLIVLGATTIPATWTGASATWSSVLGAALCLCPILAYALFTAAMPRSGGDYIFVSRTFHPWLGFVSNFIIGAGFVLGAAANIYLAVTFGLSTTFATFGETTHSSTLREWAHSVTSPGWALAIGAACLLAIGVLLCCRMKWMLRVLGLLVALMFVGLLTGIAVMAVSTRADFMHAVAAYGGSYEAIIHSGAHSVSAATGKVSFGSTIAAIPFTIGLFVWATSTSYVGGELRNPRRSAIQAGVTSLLLVGVVSIVLFALAGHIFGAGFLGAATNLSNSGSKAYPFATPAFLFFFIAMLTHSTLLVVIISVGFMGSYFALAATSMLCGVRCMFAWSFDRVLPTGLAYVNDWGAPIVAAIVAVAAAVAYVAVICFVSSATGLNVFYSFVLGSFLTFGFVAVAAVVFPVARRDMYENSAARWSVGKVPVMSIVGILSVPVLVWSLVEFLTNDALGANNSTGLITVGGILVLGIVIWPVAYYLNRARGLDLLANGRELPPE